MSTSLEEYIDGHPIRHLPQGPLIKLKNATATATSLVFTQTDIDNNTTACALTSNNAEVGKGSNGDALYGKVVQVSAEFHTSTTSDSAAINATPKYVYVRRADGNNPLELKYNTATASKPAMGNGVVVDGSGKVVAEPAIASNGTVAKGKVRSTMIVTSINTVTATTDDKATTVILT